jgi:hypothetical protein
MRTIADAADERIVRTSNVLTVSRGWPPMIGFPVSVALLVPQNWPPWAFMWALAGSIYFGCKWLTWRRARVDSVQWWRHAGYLMAWAERGRIPHSVISAADTPRMVYRRPEVCNGARSVLRGGRIRLNG